MKINNIDITNYGAILLDKNISPNRVESNLTWEKGIDKPHNFSSSISFKDVMFKLLFKVADERTFLNHLGNLTEQFRMGAEVVFPDLPYTYVIWLEQKPEYVKLSSGYYSVEFYGANDFGVVPLKSFAVSGTKVVLHNQGLYLTPVRIELTVPLMMEYFKISGLSEDIQIHAVPAGAKIIIDSSTGLVTMNGTNYIKEYIGYTLPKLLSGSTTVTFNANVTGKIDFIERY